MTRLTHKAERSYAVKAVDPKSKKKQILKEKATDRTLEPFQSTKQKEIQSLTVLILRQISVQSCPRFKEHPWKVAPDNLKKGGAKNTLENDHIRFRRPESPDPPSLLASDQLESKIRQDSFGGLDCCVVFIRLVGLTLQRTAVLQIQHITNNSALYRYCIESNNATHPIKKPIFNAHPRYCQCLTQTPYQPPSTTFPIPTPITS
jgi:hypothetical protein